MNYLVDRRYKKNPLTKAEITKRSHQRRKVKHFSLDLITINDLEGKIYKHLSKEPSKKNALIEALKLYYKID